MDRRMPGANVSSFSFCFPCAPHRPLGPESDDRRNFFKENFRLEPEIRWHWFHFQFISSFHLTLCRLQMTRSTMKRHRQRRHLRRQLRRRSAEWIRRPSSTSDCCAEKTVADAIRFACGCWTIRQCRCLAEFRSVRPLRATLSAPVSADSVWKRMARLALVTFTISAIHRVGMTSNNLI